MIRVERSDDQVVVAKAYEAGQEHIFRYWDDLEGIEKERLISEVSEIDFQLVRSLLDDFISGGEKSKTFENLSSPKVISLPKTEEEHAHWTEAQEIGLQALQEGKVAALMVAGGQATRLGYDKPKGTYPIGPISGKSLFQILIEKIQWLKNKYKAKVPLFVMTSEENDTDVKDFFDANSYFGMNKSVVSFFSQFMIPAVDNRGKLLLVEKGRLFRNPDGHGGVVDALSKRGVIDDMKQRGVEHIFYFQVDNPLVKVLDPSFIGFHIKKSSDMSLKSIQKRDASEKVGMICEEDGKPRIVEYSDLSEKEQQATDEHGNLKYRHANPAIHIFKLEFLEKMAKNDNKLPYHTARKAIPYIGKDGTLETPDKPNGIKFEKFVFDLLDFAKKSIVVECDRYEEFAPVKNATGEDSPETAHKAMANLYGKWLEAAGVQIPRDKNGDIEGKIEISPLFANSAEDLVGKIDEDMSYSGALLLS